MGAQLDRIVIGCTPLGVALPCGVKMTALGLDEGTGSARLWLGLPLLAAGVVGLECLRRCAGLARADRQCLGVHPGKVRSVLQDVLVLRAVLLVLAPVATVLQFVLLLDGHVRLRVCAWLLLAYAAGVAVVWAGRPAGTSWGSCLLWWGWAPVIAFGVPLALPALLATGLVQPSIPLR